MLPGSGYDGRVLAARSALGGLARGQLGVRRLIVAGVAAAAVVVALAGAVMGSSHTGQPERAHAYGPPARQGLAGVPLLAQPLVSAVLGRQDVAYRVVGLGAANSAQRLEVAFSRAGATVVSGSGRVRFSLAAFGYASALRAVGAVAPRVAANRVVYGRAGVSEWYTNGPSGLEQGFDVRSRPTVGSGALTLAVALVGDLRGRLERRAALLTLRGARLRYGGLVVTDARGRVLRSRLQLAGARVLIRVDDRGARYPLRIDPFIQQGQMLVGDDAIDAGRQGTSVAVSADGSTALIGASGDDGGVGAAWVFTRSGSTWTQQGSKLTANDEAGGGDFGDSVALSADGDTALIGGSSDNSGVGAAWVFTRSDSTWTQQGSKLTANDETGIGRFGLSLALSADGSTALIGGPWDTPSADGYTGAAWVFSRTGSIWTQQGSKLASPCGLCQAGRSVALSGDGSTALIGSVYADAAVVFTRSGSSWAQQGSGLIGSGAIGGGNEGSGVALSADGNTALLGDPSDTGNVGAAWVFTRSGSTWTQQGSKLVGSGGWGYTSQGYSVSLSADGRTALIGGPADNDDVGAGWVFTRSGTTWTQQGSKLVGSGGWGYNVQGSSVALSANGRTALIGGPETDGDMGAAWVFALAQSTLTVGQAGTGSGTVISQPTGISCGSSCSSAFDTDTQVNLTATPASGSTFAGWSGGGCTGTATCTVTLSSDTTITATFNALRRLTVTKMGSGSGRVTSNAAGIDCGTICGATFTSGEVVTLTAMPTRASVFAGWSGACTGTSQTCEVALSTDQSVAATFQAKPALSRLSVSPKAFRPANSGPSTQPASRRSNRGTPVRYTLNEPAMVRFTIEQQLLGYKKGTGKHARCVAPTKHNQNAPRCVRTVTLHGSFTVNGKTGTNSFRFTGRLAGRTLAPGSYTLIATPTEQGLVGNPIKTLMRISA